MTSTPTRTVVVTLSGSGHARAPTPSLVARPPPWQGRHAACPARGWWVPGPHSAQPEAQLDIICR